VSKWQYRLRYTNLNWGDGGQAADWQNITGTPDRAIDLSCCAHLTFRKKPGRLAALRRWLRYPAGRKSAP
jgi:hypothetical protein